MNVLFNIEAILSNRHQFLPQQTERWLYLILTLLAWSLHTIDIFGKKTFVDAHAASHL